MRKTIREVLNGTAIYKANARGRRHPIIKGKVAKIPIGKDMFVIVDTSDLNRALKKSWVPSKAGRTFYAVARKVKLHRWILGLTDPKVWVDHKNFNGLDCRRSNLRLANPKTSSYNKRPHLGRKYKGVQPSGKKWRASIGYEHRHLYLGTFDTREEAARAYDAKARELFGEFAWLNFPEKFKGPKPNGCKHTAFLPLIRKEECSAEAVALLTDTSHLLEFQVCTACWRVAYNRKRERDGSRVWLDPKFVQAIKDHASHYPNNLPDGEQIKRGLG